MLGLQSLPELFLDPEGLILPFGGGYFLTSSTKLGAYGTDKFQSLLAQDFHSNSSNDKIPQSKLK